MFDIRVKTDLRSLLNLAPSINRRLRQVRLAGGRKLQEAARARAPKRTGYMAAMITVDRTPSPAAEQMIRVYGGASYTVYQEARVHFLEQALSENEGAIFNDAQLAVFAAVDEVNR